MPETTTSGVPATTFDERTFVARIESADARELERLVAQPTIEEERVLRAHLGDAPFQRMHSMALRVAMARSDKRATGILTKRNVVVLPGFMGSELASFVPDGPGEAIWPHALPLAAGAFSALALAPDGRAAVPGAPEVRSTGVLKRHYGELLLALSARYNVRAFHYDWRKDVAIAADRLNAQLSTWFADEDPVHLVAHSTGGLVARAFIARHPARWEKMKGSGDRSRGRLVLLGTPNHGTFDALRLLLGTDPLLDKLDRIDTRNGRNELAAVLRSFPALYEMLPSPLVLPEMRRLYESAFWGEGGVVAGHLERARALQDALRGIVDAQRMVYVAGVNVPTLADVASWDALQASRAAAARSDGGVDDTSAYSITSEGDGRVPHALGLLRAGDVAVPTYYLEASHEALPSHPALLDALAELLEKGASESLPATAPAAPPGEAQAAGARVERERGDLDALEPFVRRARSRAMAAEAPKYVSGDEREVEDNLTRGWLVTSKRRSAPQPATPAAAIPPVEIVVTLAGGGIGDPDLVSGEPRIDAFAVGHYTGVRPQAAELALDEVVTRALLGPQPVTKLADTDLVLTQYTDRGIIRGELAQPFLIPHPTEPGIVIAIAGLGLPGRFGRPELTVMVRELCWSLGWIGKKHLATVLIGAGNGNLSLEDAVSGWLRGLDYALWGATHQAGRTLRRVSFVEFDRQRFADLEAVFVQEIKRVNAEGRLKVTFEALPAPEKLGAQADSDAAAPRGGPNVPETDEGAFLLPPTRITVSLEGRTYRFGAITSGASIPERQIPLDPALVARANDEAAAERDLQGQVQSGRFLEKLLFPADLRDELRGAAPVVLILDAATARIHWEILGQPDSRSFGEGLLASGEQADTYSAESFLATSRGLTRQLRSTFAPPPEPPPPPRRVLRVLVVADPAEDARLPGAEEEGVAVADLFERFNGSVLAANGNRVEVTRLFGPRDGTRTNVMRRLMQDRPYDVLHFAGHCAYDEKDPAASGWIFSGRERLSAYELNRIDKVPRFIFSNACESGITPDRSELRSAALAPSFAEAFFARGVANFVCTAWPVDDVAAREFATCLYANLLGLPEQGEDSPEAMQRAKACEGRPRSMHQAMHEARTRIATSPHGVRTWGAYQHYGNPYFRFFEALRTRSD